MVDQDADFFRTEASESPERFVDNVKTFKPKILVGGTVGSYMSRNAMI
jgi:hypothetical protein